MYGIYNEERGAANRAVFVVDKDGFLKFQKVYSSMNEFDMDEDEDEVIGGDDEGFEIDEDEVDSSPDNTDESTDAAKDVWDE